MVVRVMHAVFAARQLIQQATCGGELPGVPILERAQEDLALAGGYVATIWTTELSQRIERRPR